MSTGPALAANKINVGYSSGNSVVRELDLEVDAGEIVALLGANGAGKTTTILALAGVLRPSSGEVTFLGHRRAGPLQKRARAGLGLLTEEKCVFQSLSARDNLRLGRGSVSTAVKYFPELEEHLDRRAGLLSGGQQQMLGLARVLAADPKVILADELSLGLAPMIVDRLLAVLRSAADNGVAVLLVEQHIQQALKWSDRGYVLRRGRVAMAGTAAELATSASDVADLYIQGES